MDHLRLPKTDPDLATDPGPGDTLTSRTYTALREEITRGKLAPGTKLVRRKLSRRLGVSTIPVMEALHRLERDGLVEHQTYSGTRVRTMTVQAIRDDNDLREALESQIARLCAQRCQSDDFNRLYYLAGRIDGMMASSTSSSSAQSSANSPAQPPAQTPEHLPEHSSEQSSEWMQMHMDFHLALARCSGCAPLIEELEKLWVREMMLFCWHSACFQPVPADWHHALVVAIASGDPARADAKSREHTRYGTEEFLSHLHQIDAPPHTAEAQN